VAGSILGTAIAAQPKVAEFPWPLRSRKQSHGENQPDATTRPCIFQARQWGLLEGCPLRSRFDTVVAALKAKTASAPPGNAAAGLKRQLAEPAGAVPSVLVAAVRKLLQTVTQLRKACSAKGRSGARPAGCSRCSPAGLPGSKKGGLRGASGLSFPSGAPTALAWTAESGSGDLLPGSGFEQQQPVAASSIRLRRLRLDHLSRTDRWRSA